MTHHPLWKGYVSDVGGPSANFRHPSCRQQKERGHVPEPAVPCADALSRTSTPTTSDYLALLRKLRPDPRREEGVRAQRHPLRLYALRRERRVLRASLCAITSPASSRSRPSTASTPVLDYMGKPHIGTYERFMDEVPTAQPTSTTRSSIVVPYLMSSHPGSTLDDAVALAEYLNRTRPPARAGAGFLPHAGHAIAPACTTPASTPAR